MAEGNIPEFDFSGEFDDINSIADIPEDSVVEELPVEPAAGAASVGSAVPAPKEGETTFFAWQVCLANEAAQSLENAEDYPNYIVNRDAIVQMLGVGMASGQNAFPVDGQMFVVAVSIQVDGEVTLISPNYPFYNEVAAVISEQLLSGKDHGMVALLPNGKIISVKIPGEL